jgi:hypothetical protein
VRNTKIFRNKSIKEKLSQVYLNLSENRIFEKIASFRELKDVRNKQKRDALEYYEKSKRPAGNDMGLHSFYLFEIFFSEDLSELGKILDNLFAKSSFSLTNESFQSFLEEVSNRPGRAMCALPLIVNKRTGFIPADRICIDNMPAFIKCVEPKIIKILPSLVIMTMRVIIDEELVNAKINQVLEHGYQQRIIFHTYLPWRISKSGMTLFPPHHEKSEACRNIMRHLKYETECFIAKYFQGFYLSKKGGTNRCPSLDVYTISQLPEEADIINWAWSAQEYWRLVGFEYIYNKIWFKNNYGIFYYGSISEFPYVNKLLISESSVSGSESPGFGQSVQRIVSNTCEEFLFPMSLLGLFGELNENIRKLKTVLFSYIKKRRGSRFRRLLRLQNLISFISIKIDNVISEYKKTPTDDRRDGNIEFKDLANQKTLSEAFSENIDYVIDDIKRILDPVEAYARDYFSNENIRVNYLLQKSIFILTVAILFLTLLQFGPNMWSLIRVC